MFVPDKAKSYSEVHRALAPGGRYMFSVWDAHRYNPFGRIAHEIAGRFFPADRPQFFSVPLSCHQIDPIKESLKFPRNPGGSQQFPSLDSNPASSSNHGAVRIWSEP
jgi:hypothetical protein